MLGRHALLPLGGQDRARGLHVQSEKRGNVTGDGTKFMGGAQEIIPTHPIPKKFEKGRTKKTAGWPLFDSLNIIFLPMTPSLFLFFFTVTRAGCVATDAEISHGVPHTKHRTEVVAPFCTNLL